MAKAKTASVPTKKAKATIKNPGITLKQKFLFLRVQKIIRKYIEDRDIN